MRCVRSTRIAARVIRDGGTRRAFDESMDGRDTRTSRLSGVTMCVRAVMRPLRGLAEQPVAYLVPAARRHEEQQREQQDRDNHGDLHDPVFHKASRQESLTIRRGMRCAMMHAERIRNCATTS